MHATKKTALAGVCQQLELLKVYFHLSPTENDVFPCVSFHGRYQISHCIVYIAFFAALIEFDVDLTLTFLLEERYIFLIRQNLSLVKKR